MEQIIKESEYKPFLDEFAKKLNKQPNPKVIKTNRFSQGAKYIPISVLESAMDSLFMGLWKTENMTYSIELNSIIVTMDVSVFNPVAKTWITRTGIGAVPIEISKATGELSAKALHKNAPAAKAYAFRNAVLSLGRRFGRNLNREFDFNFTPDTENFNDKFLNKDND